MTQTLDIEKILLDNLRMLSTDKQQEVLDFAQFLVHKLHQTQDLSKESDEYSSLLTQPPPLKLSFTEIAKLPIAERHKILAPYIAATAEDFLTDPELTEFSVLDSEDWETEYDCQLQTRRDLASTTRSNPRPRNSENSSGCYHKF